MLLFYWVCVLKLWIESELWFEKKKEKKKDLWLSDLGIIKKLEID